MRLPEGLEQNYDRSNKRIAWSYNLKFRKFDVGERGRKGTEVIEPDWWWSTT